MAAGAKAQQELRVAKDGKAYSVNEFWEHYGNGWEQKWYDAWPLVQKAPEGLHTGKASPDLVEKALREIRPWFLGVSQEGNRKSVEIGWTLDHSHHADYRLMEGLPLSHFPEVHNLVYAVTSQLGGNIEDLDQRLNVSCLLYSSGSSIGFHCDRFCYTSEIYGCILSNDSDSSLEFQDPTEPSVRYVMDEPPGRCFVQRGPARYEWQHGVAPLGCGHRLSVTWRWFSADLSMK